MTRIRKAVIPAAGLGTRFYPLTRAQPKEMLPLVDKPVIHYVVEEALLSGLDEILIVVGPGKEAIINYFDSSNLDKMLGVSEYDDIPEIYFVRQRQLLGLADAVRYAHKFVDDEPFVVLLGDTVYRTRHENTITKELINAHSSVGKSIIALEEVSEDKFKDYGMVASTAHSNSIVRINNLVEKPNIPDSPGKLGITGLYLLEPEIFDFIDVLNPGKNNEYQLTDALSSMAAQSELYGYIIDGERFDIGDMEKWIAAFLKFLKLNPKFSHLLDKN